MLAGAVLTLGWGAVFAVHLLHPPPPPPPEGYGPIAGFFDAIVAGVAGSAVWLSTARGALAGRGSARTWSTVCFGLYFAVSFEYLIGAYTPPNPRPSLVAGPVGVGLELWFGLVALVLLWQPASTQFFGAAKQARLGPYR
jgi:hypothetical protein